MKLSEMRHLTHSPINPQSISDVQDTRQLLAAYGIDPAGIYQELEMDSAFVDTHGDTSTTLDFIRLHSHTFFEILYCRSSGLEYLLGTDRYRIRQGDVIFVPPGCSHRPLFLEKLVEPYTRYVVWASPRFAACIREAFPQLELLPDTPFVLRTANTPYERAGTLFRQGVEESAARKPGLAGGAVWQHGAAAGGTAARPHPGPHPAPRPKPKLTCWTRFSLISKGTCPKKITLADTARQFLVSESTIDQLFRKRMKASFYHFVTQRRLIAAKTELLEGATAEQAAARTGFGDYSTFYRAFRREYGISPAEYRRRNTEK